MKKIPGSFLILLFILGLALFVAAKCSEGNTTKKSTSAVVSVANADQEREIRSLIEQLVFENKPGSEEPPFSPGVIENDEDYRKRFKSCQSAFNKLAAFRELAFPFLIEHLKDNRQSIPFRNHHMGFSVGDACYWNMFMQLQDRPKNYSEYGYQRKGRDGKMYVQVYQEGTPFDAEGGLVKWIEKNKGLTLAEKQIKCLQWLLEKEKQIGAADEDSYFLNILPLEVRILERRQEAGENVAVELQRMRRIQEQKLVDQIPLELLPSH